MALGFRRLVPLVVAGALLAGCGKDDPLSLRPVERAWQPYDGGAIEGAINALTTYQGDLVMAGLFVETAGEPTSNVARWDGTGWHSLGSGTDGEVTALVEYGGALVAGGFFRLAGDQPAPGIARWNGTAWTGLGTGLSGASASVSAIAAFKGNLVVAGHFQKAGDRGANNLALWDGARWKPVDGGIDGIVYSMASQGGRLYISYHADQSTAPQLISWDGQSWADHGAGLPQAVLSMTEFEGALVTGASGDVFRKENPWRSFGSPDGEISSLAVFDGRLVAAGSFTTMNGAPARGVAEWDGSRWSAMGSGLCLPVRNLTEFHGDLVGATALPYPGLASLCGSSFTDFRLVVWAPVESPE